MVNNRKIILEDGQQYCGLAFGYETDKVCELVFSMSFFLTSSKLCSMSK